MSWKQGKRCINRNILECKDKRKSNNLCRLFVLIETYWNVKNNDEMDLTAYIGINRNIVECKVAKELINTDWAATY